jgi:DNA-binding response OmpR family regulator
MNIITSESVKNHYIDLPAKCTIMKVLIIEDEKELSNSIVEYLKSENCQCDIAYDFAKALEKIRINTYDCIILDLTLPNGNGLDILKEIKNNAKTEGVLIISAKNSLEDKVKGLQLGADDYLSKPFYLAELGARLQAITRRKSFNGSNKIAIGPLILDIADKTLKGQSGYLELTKKEIELLFFFISNKNKFITKEAIADHLWGNDMYVSNNYNFIYTHIKNLRRKLMQEGCPDCIKVIYGVGYKFELA